MRADVHVLSESTFWQFAKLYTARHHVLFSVLTCKLRIFGGRWTDDVFLPER